MTRKQDFLGSGSLDPDYEQLSSSVTDYCFRLRKNGKVCVYAGRSFVQGQTAKENDPVKSVSEEAEQRDRERLGKVWPEYAEKPDVYYGNRER